MMQKVTAQTRGDPLPAGGRYWPLDALRGLMMVLMALDHANYFVAQQHSSGEYWGGPFPSYDQALPFLTRWVTHLAAPGFFFLMGAGITLLAQSRRRLGWSEWAVARHLLLRGGVLILLQLLVVNLAWAASPGGWAPQVYLGVLFALGGTMILASLLLRLRANWLLLVAGALLLATEWLHPDPAGWQAFPPAGLRGVLTLLGLVPGGSPALWSNYPLLPWFELVVFGMAFGRLLLVARERLLARVCWLGGAFLLTFLVLRILDGFGNVRPRVGDSWIDFLNVVKYPPSITFTLMTMGINLLLLGLLARLKAPARRLLAPLTTFGRSPLFFYLTHLFLYAGLGQWYAPRGTSIPAMLPCWLLGLVLLYFPCQLYGEFKQARPVASIWRLF